MQNFILFQWMSRHPRLAAWIILSIGMIVIITFQAWDVGLEPFQWFALYSALILTAGACIWIVSWEDETDDVILTDEAGIASEQAPADVDTAATP